MKKMVSVSCKMVSGMLLLLTVGFLCRPFQVKAAGVTQYLTAASTAYDLNNDGKKDIIRMESASSSNGYAASLYINGVKQLSFPSFQITDQCGYRVLTLDNGKNFLIASAEGPNPGISEDVLLQYTKRGSIKKIFCFQEATAKFGSAGLISQDSTKERIKVSGNTVTVRYEKMLWTTGAVDLMYKFSYKGGTLKRSSYTGLVDRTQGYITAKKIQTYKSTSTKNKSVAFKKNTTVYLKKFYLKGSKMYLYFQNSAGRGGWVKCLTKSYGGNRSPLFTNGYYAG